MARVPLLRPSIYQPKYGHVLSEFKDIPPTVYFGSNYSGEDFFWFPTGNSYFDYYWYANGGSRIDTMMGAFYYNGYEDAKKEAATYPLTTPPAGYPIVTGSQMEETAGVYRWGTDRTRDAVWSNTLWIQRGGGPPLYFYDDAYEDLGDTVHPEIWPMAGWRTNLEGILARPGGIPRVDYSGSMGWSAVNGDEGIPIQENLAKRYRDWTYYKNIGPKSTMERPGAGETLGMAHTARWFETWDWPFETAIPLTHAGVSIPVDLDQPVTVNLDIDAAHVISGSATGVDFSVEVGVMPMHVSFESRDSTPSWTVPLSNSMVFHPGAHYFLDHSNFTLLYTVGSTQTGSVDLTVNPRDFPVDLRSKTPNVIGDDNYVWAFVMRPKVGPENYPTTKNIAWYRSISTWVNRWHTKNYQTLTTGQKVTKRLGVNIDLQDTYRMTNAPVPDMEEFPDKWDTNTLYTAEWHNTEPIAMTKEEADRCIPAAVREAYRGVRMLSWRWVWPSKVWTIDVDHPWFYPMRRRLINGEYKYALATGSTLTDSSFGQNMTKSFDSADPLWWFPRALVPSVFTMDWEEISVDVVCSLQWWNDSYGPYSALVFTFPEPMTGYVFLT